MEKHWLPGKEIVQGTVFIEWLSYVLYNNFKSKLSSIF